MTTRLRFVFSLVTVALCGCATTPSRSWEAIAARTPAPVVIAAGETDAVGTANADAADDPAIWRNPAAPSASLIVGTDKRAGLYVYGLDGRERHFVNAGRVNNVDLIEARVGGRDAILVAASDRNDITAAQVALFTLNPASGRLTALGKVAAGAGESYGLCLAPRDGGVDAYMVLKDGTVHQIALDLSGAPSGRIVRSMKLATQSEGCVVDPRTGRLYVAEENVGIWRFDPGTTTPVKVAAVDGTTLVADVEGVALAPQGDRGGWLLVSSQGDNAYALFDIVTDRFVGRFRIAAGRYGATSETDGIGLAMGDLPGYPGGLFVAQDGDNGRAPQNFKLVPWASIVSAVGI